MARKKLLSLLTVIFLFAAAFGIKGYSRHYVWAAGRLVSRTAQQVDLRDAELSVADYQRLQEKLPQCRILWNVPFQGQYFESTVRKISVTELSEEDAAILDLFPELSSLDAARCEDYRQLLSFAESHPSCLVEYLVPVGDTRYPGSTRILRITDPDLQELRAMLPWLPRVRNIFFYGNLPEVSQLEAFAADYPEIQVQWTIKQNGKELRSTLNLLDLSDLTVSAQEVSQLLEWLPNTRQVDMLGCGWSEEAMRELADRHPEIFFLWEMTVGNQKIRTDVKQIDVSGQIMESTAQIEELLPYFPNLEKVVMSHCGLDDETMDALNRRYENIRFVWSVQIKDVSIRTDADFFYPFKYYREMTVDNEDLYPLRYCTDMVAIDIGHMWGVTDCEWAAFMPNLKYLILVETQILDLTPLSNLKNLVYLEIFKTRITDYSPLLGCTALEDINMCRTYGDYTPIAQMHWLKNVWWNGIAGTRGMPCSGAETALPEALPNTNLVFYGQNNSYRNGWRDLDNYKAMRDVMGMFYLR